MDSNSKDPIEPFRHDKFGVDIPRTTKQVWLRVFRWAVAISVAVALFITIKGSVAQMADLDFQFKDVNLGLLLLAMLSYIAALIFCCFFWRSALFALDCKPTWRKTLFAFFASQLGKYIPGKAMVVAIRADVVRGEQVEAIPAAASVFVETLTWIFVGSVIACVLMIVRFDEHTALKWTAAGLACCTGLLTFPPIFRFIAAKLTRTDEVVFAKLTFSTMAVGWLVMTLAWCLNGLSLWLVLASLPAIEIGWGDFPLALACVSLATVAGFVSLLPGGIGVRELVIIPLLGPHFGPAIAIIAAILIRLIWISAELFSTAIIYIVHRAETKTFANDKKTNG